MSTNEQLTNLVDTTTQLLTSVNIAKQTLDNAASVATTTATQVVQNHIAEQDPHAQYLQEIANYNGLFINSQNELVDSSNRLVNLDFRDNKALMVNDSGTPSILTGYAGGTTGVARQIPSSYVSVQAVLFHLGGSGASTDNQIIVASSDDIGPGDYSLGTGDANLKKFITPSRNGVETNAISTDGGYTGWVPVTFNNNNLVTVPDGGTNVLTSVASDIIPVDSQRDITNNSYSNHLYRWTAPALDAATGKTGVITRSSYTGITTGSNMRTDAGGRPMLLQATRTGNNVTNPSTWTRANTPSFSGSSQPPIAWIFRGTNRWRSIMFIMDSRGDVSSEFSTTRQYNSFAFKFETQAKNKKYTVIRSSWSGGNSELYTNFANSLLIVPNIVTDAVILGYSVNDGSPSDAVLNTSRLRVINFLRRCHSMGVRPRIITAFPRQNGYGAADLARLRTFEQWCRTKCDSVYSAIDRLGDSNANWLSGYGFDTNHQTDLGQTFFASDYYDFIAN